MVDQVERLQSWCMNGLVFMNLCGGGSSSSTNTIVATVLVTVAAAVLVAVPVKATMHLPYLLYARHYACFYLMSATRNQVGIIITPFYGCITWGTERLMTWSRVIKLMLMPGRRSVIPSSTLLVPLGATQEKGEGEFLRFPSIHYLTMEFVSWYTFPEYSWMKCITIANLVVDVRPKQKSTSVN